MPGPPLCPRVTKPSCQGFPYRHLPPHCQRCWVLHGHGALDLMLMYFALVLPSVSAYCVPVCPYVEHYTYLPSRQSGKSVVPAAVSATLFSKAPVTHFQCSLANHPLPPSLPAEPMLRITATWYHMLSGGHRLPPFSRASFTSWVSCQLHQLYRWSCSQRQLSCCSHCLLCLLNSG